MRKLILFVLLLCGLGSCHAAAPVCLYQDVLSGPASGGEGGNGIYVSIFGHNFGSTQGTSTVTVNGTPVAQYLVWGSNNDATGNHDQISVQIASGTTGTGNIVVTTPGGSCSNLTFTVRSGNIYFIGSGIDTDAPGNNCTAIKNGTAGNGAGGNGTYTNPWTLTNAVNIDTYSEDQGAYSSSTQRTPRTYYECLSAGDTLVFLNGAQFLYGDGSGLHTSFALDRGVGTASSFFTFMARPGATVKLGAQGNISIGLRGYSDTYVVLSGLNVTGSGGSGTAVEFGATQPFTRVVGINAQCPDCSGESAALEMGAESDVTVGLEILGNYVTGVSCSDSGGVSNKQYHSMYFFGNGIEVGWNKISGVCAQNGIQINYYEDNSIGFGNLNIHDNDISGPIGAGINMASIDPAQGPVNVYNNVIHHTGIQPASDGNGNTIYACISFPGYAPTAAGGTAYVYNNTMYDCASYLNSYAASSACGLFLGTNSGQTNFTVNFSNNILFEPSYANTSAVNPMICGDNVSTMLSGTNNIVYSASTCTSGCTSYTELASTTVANPLFVTAADGPWTNYELESTSPAIGAGSASLYPALDFAGYTRPSKPSIGALEYASALPAVQITVTASPSPATLGQAVTLTATVTQTSSSTPTGSINFMNGSVSLGQASLDGEGTATLVLSSLSVGSYKVIAAYSGDSNYSAGESAYVPFQVLSTTTISLTASPNPVSAGQTLTLSATLSGDGSVWPTGTVSFFNGSTLLGTATIDSSAVATLSTTFAATGTYSLTAQYSGDSNFLTSTSAAAAVTVNAQATTTSLAASPNPVTTGQTLTLTAAVEASGSTTPAGTVSFFNGSTLLGTGTLNASGVATITNSSLAPGTYSLTAQYAGSTNFLTSTSAAAAVTVNAQFTTTSLAASPNPVTTGQTLTLTADVQSGGSATPAGTVSFFNGSTLLGTATLNASGVATITSTSLAPGTYSLTAQYAGSTNFLTSTSAAAAVTVNAQFTTTSLAASPNPVTTGQTLTLTADVQSGGGTTPTGTVSFFNGSTLLGTATLNASGVATITNSSLAAGTYSLTAQYAGNTNFLTSTSAAAAVTVNGQSTTTSLAASPNPVTTGQTLTLTASVKGSTTPTGTVSFFNGSTLLGTGTLNASGVATMTTSSLAAGTYSLTAQYAGNTNFLTSTSAAAAVTVNGQSTTTSLAASPNPVTTGQTLTLTADVQSGGSTTPTGTVSFFNGSTQLGTGTLNASGVATMTTSSLAAGTYSLTAQYAGNTNFLTSTSAAAAVTVNGQSTTTSLAASPNPVTSGQTLTLTASVQSSGSGTPSGTVSFFNGSTLLGTGTLNGSGVASITNSSLAPGTYSLTAQYAGSSNFLTSTSAAAAVTVNGQSTTTSLAASPNPVTTGQTLTLTADVQSGGSTTPTGTVSFFNGSTLLGTGTLNASGVATMTTSSLAAGTYSLTAQYAGNTNFLTSTSAAAAVTVNGQSTTTSLAASPNPVTTGQTLTLTASVKGSGSTTPSGTVSFFNGSTLLGTGTLNASGVATITNSSLAAGTYSLTAQYAGNTNFLTSTSAAAAVTVNGQSTTTSLAASPNPVISGQTLTLTASVQSSGSGTPSGTVSFFNGSTLLGTGTLNGSGVASITNSSLAAGTYSLTAQYAGNTNFLTSTSAAAAVTVNGQSTTTSLAASPNPVISGQTLTLTASVQSSGSGTPSGTVSFFNGSTLLGTGTLNGSGVASITNSSLAPGTYSLTAQYAGSSNFLSSTSAAAAITVSGQATTTSLTASPNPVTTGQTMTLTASVKGSGSTTPSGTVSFFNGSTLLGTGTLNASGVATITNSSLAAGTYSLTAQYAGNTNFLTSTSAAAAVTVNGQSTTTSLAASPNPVTTGQTLTLTASVKGSGSTTPTGTVSFFNGSTLLGTGTLNASGVATMTTTSLAAGTYSLTAQYAGSTSFLTSTSAAVSLKVSAPSTTTSLAASPNPVTTGQTLTLTASVKGSGSTTPTGTVSFFNGSTLLGSGTLNASGVATITNSSLAAGTYSLTAQYVGSTNFLTSTSAAVSLKVSAQATTTSLAASPNPVTTGQTLTLTASVKGSTTPTGTVSFFNGSTLLGTGTLNGSGVATITNSSLAAGTYSLTAQYVGSTNFLTSTSTAVSLKVSAQATTTSLAASPNPVTTGQTLTLTASVKGSTTPTGTVSFFNGSTLLGTGTLNASGVATLSTNSLATGSHSLTAQYAGNTNFLTSTSAAATVTVNAQATMTNLSSSFNTTASTSTQNVQPGEAALYTLGVSPTSGTTLPAITFTVSGLPAGYSATFSPQTIAAGSNATNVTMTIQVPVQSASLERGRKLNAGLSVVAFGILLLPFGGRFRRAGKRMLRLSCMALLLAAATSIVGLSGCAAINMSSGFTNASAQTYTITVTSASASSSQTTNVTLVVE